METAAGPRFGQDPPPSFSTPTLAYTYRQWKRDLRLWQATSSLQKNRQGRWLLRQLQVESRTFVTCWGDKVCQVQGSVNFRNAKSIGCCPLLNGQLTRFQEHRRRFTVPNAAVGITARDRRSNGHTSTEEDAAQGRRLCSPCIHDTQRSFVTAGRRHFHVLKSVSLNMLAQMAESERDICSVCGAERNDGNNLV